MNLRLLALGATALCAVALPLTIASAGQVGEGGAGSGSAGSAPGAASSGSGAAPASGRPAYDDPKPAGLAETPRLLGLGLATAARCGPELTAPEGVEAQTCVLTQGEDTWARTYYRNTTGDALEAMLSLMAPGGRTVQLKCAVGVPDEPASCETPRERTWGELDGYTAVAEFARGGGEGPLLLRAGSNSA